MSRIYKTFQNFALAVIAINFVALGFFLGSSLFGELTPEHPGSNKILSSEFLAEKQRIERELKKNLEAQELENSKSTRKRFAPHNNNNHRAAQVGLNLPNSLSSNITSEKAFDESVRSSLISKLHADTGRSIAELKSMSTSILVKLAEDFMEEFLFPNGKDEGSESALARGMKLKDPKYLQIDYHHHLGFNNMRYQLKVGLYISKLLHRQLLVPQDLKMRKCFNISRCAHNVELNLLCQVREDRSFWCPLDLFFDYRALKRAGAAFLSDILPKQLPTKVFPAAFDQIYAEENLWFDSIPEKIKIELRPDQTYPVSSPKFSYFALDLGCELAPLAYTKEHYVHGGPKRYIQGLSSTFGRVSEDVIHLQGTPHRIGTPPGYWGSEADLKLLLKHWQQSFRYHPNVIKIANAAAEMILKRSPTESFMCIHIRRGDFLKSGWVGDAGNIKRVAKLVELQLFDDEPFYVATDEESDKVLAPVIALGAIRWKDIIAGLPERFIASHPLLEFEDYVGLVEQTLCARARKFLGSKCSSLTGGVFEFRSRLLGDYRRNYLLNE